MHKKKVGKFMFIPSVLVFAIPILAFSNTVSAGLNTPSRKDNGPDLNAVIESLVLDKKDLVKRQQLKDDNDNEEINELSRLQDPAYQEPQVGGSINGAGAQDKNSLNSPGDKPQVPTDQKESGSDALANITGFLKAKEGTSTDPVDGDFTPWTSWSSCPDACGRTALRSRERYCTNPAPANGGRNCEGPRFQLKLCKIKQCAVDGAYSPWSEWSSCSHKCGQGMKHRRRFCDNPKPSNGGRKCKGAHKQAKPCYGKRCQDQDSIVDIDPRTVCGYNPCMVAKCIVLPYATCVSDFKCRPVFFDSEERKVTQCTGDNLYLNVDPKAVCRFDPCKYTTCLQGTAAKCVVNTRCHPVFLDAFGKTIKCKGVFRVPARYICGFDPCSGAVCKADPTARCLVEHTCKSMFVNSFNQKMKSCKARSDIVEEKEDDDEEQTNDDDASDDDDDRLKKLMNSKLRESANYDSDDSDDDGARLSKLMSSKLRIGDKDEADDEESDERLSKLMNSKLTISEKDSDENEDEDDGEGARLSKLLKSKLRAHDSGNNDDEDDDDDDDNSRLSKLMSSKLKVSDKDDDDDDKEVSEDESSDKKSKLPSRFKPSKEEKAYRKKNYRFQHHKKYSKRVKSKHKRWLQNQI